VRLRIRRLLLETRISNLWARFDSRMEVTRVRPQTRLVLDGFPRSANSYAHVAFLKANGMDFPLASHRHSHQLILSGVRRGLPTIVLIREPGPAIASALQHAPGTPAKAGLDMYRAFYSHVLPVVDDVLVATFEEATDDFGEVIRRCNAKFGTDFEVYEKTDEAEAEVFGLIEDVTAFAYGDEGHEGRVPRPSQQRSAADEILEGLSSDDRAALAELDELYRAVLDRRSG
jgi:hypothetical protein